MKAKWLLATAAGSLLSVVSIAYCGTDAPANGLSLQGIATIVPAKSTKAEIKSLFGEPWRIVQFNDCGEAMDDQADETWEYGADGPNGAYRIHVEFNDQGIVHLIAKIPDKTIGGKATTAKAAPETPSKGMSM